MQTYAIVLAAAAALACCAGPCLATWTPLPAREQEAEKSKRGAPAGALAVAGGYAAPGLGAAAAAGVAPLLHSHAAFGPYAAAVPAAGTPLLAHAPPPLALHVAAARLPPHHLHQHVPSVALAPAPFLHKPAFAASAYAPAALPLPLGVASAALAPAPYGAPLGHAFAPAPAPLALPFAAKGAHPAFAHAAPAPAAHAPYGALPYPTGLTAALFG